ncbi:MAG TPA: lipase maturation factor family protein [Chthoniobacterales bacterium]|nr:lipase maturation factor family protein [Chthoniobacterales bacterium]
MAQTNRVPNPPSKPLVIFDGDCRFCRRWIERWRDMTGGAVEYAPYQEAATRFPEIPRENFEAALHFVDRDGTVYRGAEAVFRSLGTARAGRALLWCHEHLPGFAPVTEAAYGFVARNRRIASFFTRMLWGNEVRRPNYFGARDLFVRSLGAIYFIAFVSLWFQVDGLIGENGISPVGPYLARIREQFGSDAFLALPTLCWFNSSTGFLHFLCAAGAIISVLLMVGLAPVLSLGLLFVLYLSLTIAGQTFLSFQWDILLLETGFLALFFAPMVWRMRRGNEAPLSRVGLFLLKLLLFKLMLMSGVVKLTSGDDSWWNLTALDYHYWTQPLPTVLGWWFDQHPEWFKKFSVAFCLIIEIAAPFFIWAPRRFRHIAGILLIGLQIAIAATGNYCFFNLLTIALCLLLFEDSFGRDAARRRPPEARNDARVDGRRSAASLPGLIVLLITLPVNAMFIFSAFRPEVRWPRPIATLAGYLESFHVVSGYGLFRVMTKTRPEIIIEGSVDGIEWLSYEFKWKPGRLDQAPRWGRAAPAAPRLANVVRRARDLPAQSLVRQPPGTTASLVSGRHQFVRPKSLSEGSAPLCSRQDLRLSFHNLARTSSQRRVLETRGARRISAGNFARRLPRQIITRPNRDACRSPEAESTRPPRGCDSPSRSTMGRPTHSRQEGGTR